MIVENDKTGEIVGGIPASTEVEIETENDVGDTPASETEVSSEGEGEDGDEGLTVSFGDETEHPEDDATAPAWVKNLRKENREQSRRIRELENEAKTLRPQEKAIEVGAKPTLESCDYDGDKFETELTAWHERKQQAAAKEASATAAREADRQAWEQKQQVYQTKKAALNVKDYDDSENFVKDTLSVVQQSIILQGCNDPALVVYALGKNPARAAALANITDHVKFAFEVARLEKDLKVTTKKAPPPERVIRKGGSTLSGTTDQTLDRLRADAEKSGDYSKVVRYKQQLRAKSGK